MAYLTRSLLLFPLLAMAPLLVSGFMEVATRLYQRSQPCVSPSRCFTRPRFSSASSSSSYVRPLFASTLAVGNNNTFASPPMRNKKDRFQRTATRDTVSEQECILQVDGVHYNLTQWAKAHPGGVNVLRKFHNKDASKAFHAAGHSNRAYAMLQDFDVVRVDDSDSTSAHRAVAQQHLTASEVKAVGLSGSSSSRCPVHVRPRWQQKLFTKEDPIGIHKYLGVYCLGHFIFRFYQMFFGDISAGLGSRMGRGASWVPALFVVPHALLSLSSLIFHTVPKERVVGKPMIWQEFRAHNIVFGVRSVICTLLAWSTYYWHQSPLVRRIAVVGSCATAFTANIIADQATQRLRVNTAESTTATMPYWDGCSLETQKRFKLFYAYCQFMATMACIAVCNPSWGLAVLLAIQCASLLMTLVRKGFVSPKGYHIGYTITLALPYLIGFRNGLFMGPWKFPLMCAGGAVLFQLRRLGLNKFALWLPVFAVRILVGDRFIPYDVW